MYRDEELKALKKVREDRDMLSSILQSEKDFATYWAYRATRSESVMVTLGMIAVYLGVAMAMLVGC